MDFGRIIVNNKTPAGEWGKNYYRTNINSVGEKMFNCEVCWTCGYFSYESMKCRIGCDIDGRGRAYNKPAWYRCVDWYERD